MSTEAVGSVEYGIIGCAIVSFIPEITARRVAEGSFGNCNHRVLD